MPDLKADLSEEDLLNLASGGNSSGSDDSGLQGDDDASASQSCRFYVRLSKKQIDKASKDNSDRFLENFAVTLLISRTAANQLRDSWQTLERQQREKRHS